METAQLSHQGCIELVAEPHRKRTGRVAVDGSEPLLVACFVESGGDVLVPTGRDPQLARTALGKPVAVEIDVDSSAWTITGVGLAVQLRQEDRPGGPTGLRYAFENGIRIRVARLRGWRFPDAVGIPDQRRTEAKHEAAATLAGESLAAARESRAGA